jgi:hypothetical protein
LDRITPFREIDSFQHQPSRPVGLSVRGAQREISRVIREFFLVETSETTALNSGHTLE